MKIAGKSGRAGQEINALFGVTPDIKSSGALMMGVSPNMLPGFVKARFQCFHQDDGGRRSWTPMGITYPKDIEAVHQEISGLVPELATVKW